MPFWPPLPEKVKDLNEVGEYKNHNCTASKCDADCPRCAYLMTVPSVAEQQCAHAHKTQQAKRKRASTKREHDADDVASDSEDEDVEDASGDDASDEKEEKKSTKKKCHAQRQSKAKRQKMVILFYVISY